VSTTAQQLGEALGRHAFDSIFETLPDAMILTNHQGVMVLVNRQVEKMFGYARNELIGQPVEFLIPERYKRPHEKHREHFSQHPHTRPMGLGLNLYARHKDGHEFPVEISLSHLYEGETLLISAAVRDVSERKALEEAVRINDKRMKLALDQSSTMIFNQDTELRYTWVYNPPRVLVPEWFIGKRDAELFGQQDARLLTELKQHVLVEQVAIHQEVDMTIAQQKRNFDMYLSPHTGNQGELLGIIGVATDITEQKQTEVALARLNHELEKLVQERTLELAKANAELSVNAQERTRLYQALLKSQEHERARISRDLHDVVGQALTAIQLFLDEAIRRPNAEKLLDLKGFVAETLHEVRKLSHALRPSLLDEVGLEAALKQYAREVAERSPVEVTVVAHLPYELTEDQEIALYRITQEALTNVVRHAEATRASVVLTGMERSVQLVIEDDGVGFDRASVSDEHLGLLSIRERSELIGGSCHIESSPGKGTSVHVRIPR
jgi:PAS domain S-box-containing protein